MEAKPLRIVPYSHNSSGGGPLKKIDMVHAMEEGVVVVGEGKERVVMVKEEKDSSFSSVELHLGVDASHSAAQPDETINHVITEAQRSELHHQVFIFNHLAYKLAPPHHLVQFPSNMSEYSFLGFDHGGMVDPEPDRCRRTDGKKWRCGKNVVPNQKYCERHMHRGRNRSRKPVETSQVNSPLAIKPCSKSHTKPASRGEFEISNPKPLAIYPSDTSSNTPSRILSVGNCPSANNRSKIVATSTNYLTPNASASVVPPGSPLVAAVTPKMTTFTSATTAASDEKSCLKMFKKDYQSKSCTSNNMGVKSGGKGNIVGDTNGISTGIGFSPRSVLQVSVCKPSYLNDRTNIEPASSRCRRTDGKKWQCKSAVLPGQKYCARHMHRGAKKRVKAEEPAATTTSAVTIAQLPYSSATTNNQKAHCAIPNTNLSMSVAASAPFIECNEKSCHSSSDTDTTISDTLNECSYASF